MNVSLNDQSADENARVAKTITDLRIPGQDTVIEVVQAYAKKNREWLRDPRICEWLATTEE
jgi:hypothetical protein